MRAGPNEQKARRDHCDRRARKTIIVPWKPVQLKRSAGRSRWERRAKENDNGSVRAGSNDQSRKGSLGRKENDNGSLRASSIDKNAGRDHLGERRWTLRR